MGGLVDCRGAAEVRRAAIHRDDSDPYAVPGGSAEERAALALIADGLTARGIAVVVADQTIAGADAALRADAGLLARHLAGAEPGALDALLVLRFFGSEERDDAGKEGLTARIEAEVREVATAAEIGAPVAASPAPVPLPEACSRACMAGLLDAEMKRLVAHLVPAAEVAILRSAPNPAASGN